MEEDSQFHLNLLYWMERTGEQVTDVDLKVTLGESNVEILKNTNGMSNVTPTIIPTQSGAGVGINSIVFKYSR